MVSVPSIRFEVWVTFRWPFVDTAHTIRSTTSVRPSLSSPIAGKHRAWPSRAAGIIVTFTHAPARESAWEVRFVFCLLGLSRTIVSCQSVPLGLSNNIRVWRKPKVTRLVLSLFPILQLFGLIFSLFEWTTINVWLQYGRHKKFGSLQRYSLGL